MMTEIFYCTSTAEKSTENKGQKKGGDDMKKQDRKIECASGWSWV
jgi:hypothetical protein